jgi:hypothetical protein
MRNPLQERIRHANIVLVATAPIFAVVAILLRDAGEAVLQGAGLIYFFVAFALFFYLGERADKHRNRRDQ